MKFLLDAHVPPSLCRVLVEHGHNAIHTSSLPNGNASADDAVRTIASAEARVVITKDVGFFDDLALHGPPPKVVLLRCGNLKKRELIALVIAQLDAIVAGLESNDLVELRNEV